MVIELNNVTKSYSDRTLINELSFSVPKIAIVGIIGGNGAGKSTLFRMITGAEQPDSGEIKIGETVDIAYVEQLRDEMDNNAAFGNPSRTAMSKFKSVARSIISRLHWSIQL